MRALLEYWQEHPPVDAVVRGLLSSGSAQRGTMHDLAGALGVSVPPPKAH